MMMHPPSCINCERCTWNPGPDCDRPEHQHCTHCGHCMGRHNGNMAIPAQAAPPGPTYRIRCAFRPDLNGERVPELVATVDEYTMDAWGLDVVDCPLTSMPDFYLQSIRSGGTVESVRELIITVPQAELDALFRIAEAAAGTMSVYVEPDPEYRSPGA